ncbi:MAG TPA: PIN domain-containing protein [Streptosporangiaceae bacterium]|nr:PIN domain-containing protein [Streptosporangiaceae bacterium]
MQPEAAIPRPAPLPAAPVPGQREVFARLRTYGWLGARSDWFSGTRSRTSNGASPPSPWGNYAWVCCRPEIPWRLRDGYRRIKLAERFEALPVDSAVSDAWALLVSKLRAAGRKAPVNDSWIAATAIAHRIPVVTQNNDYDDMPDLQIIKI